MVFTKRLQEALSKSLVIEGGCLYMHIVNSTKLNGLMLNFQEGRSVSCVLVVKETLKKPGNICSSVASLKQNFEHDINLAII